MMPTEIVIELEEAEIEELKQEYGELLGVDNLVKEIVLNNLKNHKELKGLHEETKLLNLGSAKLNAAIGQYEQLLKHQIAAITPEDSELVETGTVTVSATDQVNVEDSVTPQPTTAVRVGMDVQRVAPNSTVPAPNAAVTNQLNEGGQPLDPRVQKVMDEVRARNKAGAEQARQRKGASASHAGGIVASQ
jgi:hypothetical protein